MTFAVLVLTATSNAATYTELGPCWATLPKPRRLGSVPRGFSETGEVMKKRGAPIFGSGDFRNEFELWTLETCILKNTSNLHFYITLQLPSEVQRVFCSGLPSTKSSSAPLTAMSLQDTYGFNTKFTSTVWREPPIPTANVGWIASADPQHKKNKWPSDTPSNLTCFFQSTLLHLQGHILANPGVFLPKFSGFLTLCEWLDSHPFVFQVSFFQPGWGWLRPACPGSVPEPRGRSVATRHLEVCGNLKFPVLKFSHLFFLRGWCFDFVDVNFLQSPYINRVV